jgi:hypothetical protein
MKLEGIWSFLHVITVIICVFSYHLTINIEPAVAAVLAIFTTAFGLVPKFKVNGGSPRENIALQNIQV